MKASILSALVPLLLTAPVRADPPGVIERIKQRGGKVNRDGQGGTVDLIVLPPGTSDAELSWLCEFRRLAVLALDRTQVTEDGWRYVAGLRPVRRLVLRGDNITDAGLRRLEAMEGLQELQLFDCPNVTKEGVTRLRKALPNCRIIRTPLTAFP